MKHFTSLVILVAVAVMFCGSAPPPAFAQSTVKIAVLDLIAVRLQTKAGKSISDQLGKYRKTLQKDAEDQQKKLRSTQNELRLQRSLLSPEAMQSRERKFRDDVAAVQRGFQSRRKALDKSRMEAGKIFEEKLTEVLEKLRQERDIDLILKKRPAVVFAKEPIDITKEVIKRLDAKVKHIPVKKPGK
jgi:Skp family chaperone for outer membrane proteins